MNTDPSPIQKNQTLKRTFHIVVTGEEKKDTVQFIVQADSVNEALRLAQRLSQS